MALVSATYRNIPFTDTSTFMVEDQEKKLTYQMAIVYMSREAFSDMEKTGEFTIRPLNPNDFEWLKDNGSIKKDSRLAVIFVDASGEMKLGLRESACLNLQKNLNGHYRGVKLQNVVGRRPVSESLRTKGIESIPEREYVNYVNGFNGILRTVGNQIVLSIHSENSLISNPIF